MAKKWAVWITYGVYVDTDKDLNPEIPDDHDELVSRAVEALWSRDIQTVISECSVEYEDITEEFENHARLMDEPKK